MQRPARVRHQRRQLQTPSCHYSRVQEEQPARPPPLQRQPQEHLMSPRFPTRGRLLLPPLEPLQVCPAQVPRSRSK